jgi:hypothetical protein
VEQGIRRKRSQLAAAVPVRRAVTLGRRLGEDTSTPLSDADREAVGPFNPELYAVRQIALGITSTLVSENVGAWPMSAKAVRATAFAVAPARLFFSQWPSGQTSTPRAT